MKRLRLNIPPFVKERAFVFLAAIGVMAVLVIISSTANMNSIVSMQQTALKHDRSQAASLLSSALDNVSGALAEGDTNLYQSGNSESDAFASNVTVTVSNLTSDSLVYESVAIKFEAGDQLLECDVTLWKKGRELKLIQDRKYIWNAKRLKDPVEL